MRAWLAICGVLGLGAAAAAATRGLVPPFHDVGVEPMAWQAGTWMRQPWTLWTAAWVHTSAGALAGNLLALAALAVAGAALGAGAIAALALALAWPLTTLALLVWPEVTSYAGLGGAIHAAAAVLGVHLMRRTTLQALATIMFGGMALKLLAERGWAQPVAFDPGWGVNLVYGAHLAGALVGVWCAAVLDFLAGARPPSNPGPRPPASSP